MVTAIILIFIAGYILIALEHRTGISKTAVALILGVTLWTLYILAGPEVITSSNQEAFKTFLSTDSNLTKLPVIQQAIQYATEVELITQLGNISEIFFYLLGAMAIVELIDLHKGFSVITTQITTRKRKKLLWLLALITFLMSSVLDNLTTAIVMIMLLRKLVEQPEERRIFACMIIIAANAGGVWTPIGDVTTVMLWINNNITTASILQNLFFPSIAALIIPTALLSTMLKNGKTRTIRPHPLSTGTEKGISTKERTKILIFGILCLLAVPLFKSVTQLPPVMGVLLALGGMWVYTDTLYNRKPKLPDHFQHRMPEVLSRIDFSTLLFFLGILLSVAALEISGILHHSSLFLNEKVHNVYAIGIITGFLSSIIDNVPLVASAIDMYPVLSPTVTGYAANFVQNGTFWQLTAYCTGTGGSILVIGSAAGVVVMGLEQINFIWYMKHISLIAILGYLSGIAIYIIEKLIFVA